MKTRGFTLLAVLWFAGLWLCLSLASASIVSAVHHRVMHSKMEQCASTWATCGANYAEVMLKSGRWDGTQMFKSPDLNGTGTFTVYLWRSGHATYLQSIGEAGGVRKTVERTLP